MSPVVPPFSPPEIQIKPLEAEDVGEVIGLFHQQLREHRIEANAADLQNVIGTILQEPHRGFILVARLTGVGIVGVALASAFLGVEQGGESGWLEELYVRPECRQQGVGSRLLAEILGQARSRGWRALDLEVETDHERAVPIYERHGFRPHTRRHFFRKLT